MQFGVLLDHRDDLPAHLLGQHGHLDVFVVLEAVADDRRFVVGHRHHRHQLGLRAGFQPEPERLAELQHLFDHLPLLIHLDRDRRSSSRPGTCARAMAVSKALCSSPSRCFRISAKRIRIGREMPRSTSVSTSFLQVDRARRVLFRMDQHVAVLVDRKIALAPTGDIVQFAGVLRGPSLRRLHDEGAFTAVSFQRISLLVGQAVSLGVPV